MEPLILIVTVEERPDYDLALSRALEEYKNKISEKEEEEEAMFGDQIWGDIIFTLKGVIIDDNIRRKTFSYKFEVSKYRE